MFKITSVHIPPRETGSYLYFECPLVCLLGVSYRNVLNNMASESDRFLSKKWEINDEFTCSLMQWVAI